MGPTGVKGDTGAPGPTGPQGETGSTGPTGATPSVEIGTVSSGSTAAVTANPSENGVRLDFVVPVGPTGPQGVQGTVGPTGPQGETGSMGPQGPTGATPSVEIGTVSSGSTAAVTANPSENGVRLDFVVPVGPTGPQGVQGTVGPTGPQGETGSTGPQGPTGATPSVEIGTVSSGSAAAVTANPSENGVRLDFVVPVGPTGPQGVQGTVGPTGPQGETGSTGARGTAGETPKISEVENTKTRYVLSFTTADQNITSPNLKSNTETYNADLSTVGSTLRVPLESLTLIAQSTSSSSLRLSIQPTTTGTSVLADIRRVSIYDGSIDFQTNNNTTVSSNLVLDDTVFTQSQEMHWIRIRIQNPTSKLWSMCEIYTFASQGGARTSICVEWFYTDASFTAP